MPRSLFATAGHDQDQQVGAGDRREAAEATAWACIRVEQAHGRQARAAS